LLFKYWLTTDQDRQEQRLKERLDDPLKRWKLSPIDLAARDKYDAYTEAREAMLKATHTDHAPWTLVDFNDQKRGRLTLVRHLLDHLPDTHVPPEEIEFPELGREPKAESYSVISPIEGYPIPD
jgi:polyphosphate kinase 2 (PPK2 family)